MKGCRAFYNANYIGPAVDAAKKNSRERLPASSLFWHFSERRLERKNLLDPLQHKVQHHSFLLFQFNFTVMEVSPLISGFSFSLFLLFSLHPFFPFYVYATIVNIQF